MTRGEAIARLASVLNDLAHGADLDVTADALADIATRLREPQMELETSDGEPVAPPQESEADVVRRIFAYWQRRTGKTRARLMPEKVRRIRARLRQFSEAELKLAVEGALLSDHHTGADGGEEFLDIRTIFKNGEAVEKHVERAGAMGVDPANDTPERREVEALKQEAERAMQEGRTDDYNRINRRLKELLRG